MGRPTIGNYDYSTKRGKKNMVPNNKARMSSVSVCWVEKSETERKGKAELNSFSPILDIIAKLIRLKNIEIKKKHRQGRCLLSGKSGQNDEGQRIR